MLYEVVADAGGFLHAPDKTGFKIYNIFAIWADKYYKGYNLRKIVFFSGRLDEIPFSKGSL